MATMHDPNCDIELDWSSQPVGAEMRATVARHDGGWSVLLESTPFRKTYVCAEYTAVETILEQWLVHGKAIKLEKV